MIFIWKYTKVFNSNWQNLHSCTTQERRHSNMYLFIYVSLSIAHVIIIIKSEVSTFPIVIIFFRGRVPEMLVTFVTVKRFSVLITTGCFPTTLVCIIIKEQSWFFLSLGGHLCLIFETGCWIIIHSKVLTLCDLVQLKTLPVIYLIGM